MRVRFPIWYLVGGFAAAFAFLFLCLQLLPNTMVPVLIAWVLAYAFNPLIDHFENQGFKRGSVVFWFFILTGFLFSLFVVIVLPYLFMQTSEFMDHLPEFAKDVPALVTTFLNWVSEKIHMNTSALREKVLLFIQKYYSEDSLEKIANWLGVSFSHTANWLRSSLGMVLVPVFFYFFLRDLDRLQKVLFHWIPKPYQPFVRVRLNKVDVILSGFIRGQLSVCLILGGVYSVGLLSSGINYGVLIGLAAGILNVVPYLGVTVGLISSLIMAVLQGGNVMGSVLLVFLVFALAQALDAFFITPRMVGAKVGLSGFWTLLLILIGGELFGIAGMIMAIPTGGVGRVVFRDFQAAYLKSRFYKKEKAT